MQITATELKMNLGKYLDLVLTEDIWVSKNGRIIAKLVNPNISAVDSISGILEGKVSDDKTRLLLREDRIDRLLKS